MKAKHTWTQRMEEGTVTMSEMGKDWSDNLEENSVPTYLLFPDKVWKWSFIGKTADLIDLSIKNELKGFL